MKTEPVYSSADTMRQAPQRALHIAETDNIAAIKVAGQDFYGVVESMGNSREISLAKTKIEEAVMWAVKHVTA